MANRSYLYSISEAQTQQLKDVKIRSLSEYNYGIPVAHKLIMCANPQLVHSAVFGYEKPIAIIADFAGGYDLLKRFLLRLKQVPALVSRSDFEAALEETFEFLDDPDKQLPYLLLEAGEIYDMSGNLLEEDAGDTLDELEVIREEAEALIASTEANPFAKARHYQFENLHTQWQKELGIDCWSDVLYFQFEKNT